MQLHKRALFPRWEMQMNPYKILGVPDGADTETVKKAYYDLVKKYHLIFLFNLLKLKYIFWIAL